MTQRACVKRLVEISCRQIIWQFWKPAGVSPTSFEIHTKYDRRFQTGRVDNYRHVLHISEPQISNKVYAIRTKATCLECGNGLRCPEVP